jgi:hypothetical protein
MEGPKYLGSWKRGIPYTPRASIPSRMAELTKGANPYQGPMRAVLCISVCFFATVSGIAAPPYRSKSGAESGDNAIVLCTRSGCPSGRTWCHGRATDPTMPAASNLRAAAVIVAAAVDDGCRTAKNPSCNRERGHGEVVQA